MEVTVQLRIVGGLHLPKTDMMSEIDPFCKVFFNDIEMGTTEFIQDDPNPTWNEDFFVDTVQLDDGTLSGTLSLQLYDEDVSGNEFVGTAELDLATVALEEIYDAEGDDGLQHIPLQYRQDKRGVKLAKQGRSSQLLVRVVGYVASLATYSEQLQELEGLVVDSERRLFTVPLPLAADSEVMLPGNAQLRAGIRYSARSTEFIVQCCASGSSSAKSGSASSCLIPPSAVDFKYPKKSTLTIRRSQHAKPQKAAGGLKVLWEAALTNLSLDSQLTKLSIRVLGTGVVTDQYDLADILDTYDYKLGSAWNIAAKELARYASVDPALQHIYLPLPQGGRPKPAAAGKGGSAVGGGPAAAAAAAGARLLVCLDYSAGGHARHDLQLAGPSTGKAAGKPDNNGSKGPALKLLELDIHVTANGSDAGSIASNDRDSIYGFVGAGVAHWTSYHYRKPLRLLGGSVRVAAVHELLDALLGGGTHANSVEHVGLVRYELSDEAMVGCEDGVAGLTWKLGRVLRMPTAKVKRVEDEEQLIIGKVGKEAIQAASKAGKTIASAGSTVWSRLSSFLCLGKKAGEEDEGSRAAQYAAPCREEDSGYEEYEEAPPVLKGRLPKSGSMPRDDSMFKSDPGAGSGSARLPFHGSSDGSGAGLGALGGAGSSSSRFKLAGSASSRRAGDVGSIPNGRGSGVGEAPRTGSIGPGKRLSKGIGAVGGSSRFGADFDRSPSKGRRDDY